VDSQFHPTKNNNKEQAVATGSRSLEDGRGASYRNIVYIDIGRV
jgi:hypothetical protein